MSRLFAQRFPLCLAGAVLVAFLPAPASARDVLERLDFDLTGGNRVDRLDWNIAGNLDGNSPDVVSELTWKDVKSHTISARGKVIMTNDLSSLAGAVRLGVSYGDIYSGSGQDSDYLGDGRTQEYSRSTSRVDSGKVWDGTVGGGPVFANESRTFSLTPLVGFSMHEQDLNITDGYQVVSDSTNLSGNNPPPVGAFAGLNSNYDARWRSGWLGLDLDFIPKPYFDLHGGVEIHAGRYEADADWNLRDNYQHPRSFSHTSDRVGGVVANIGIRTGMRNLLFTLDYNYQRWRAKDGEDSSYINDGTVVVTKLNEVNWQAYSFNAGVTVRF